MPVQYWQRIVEQVCKPDENVMGTTVIRVMVRA